MAESIADCVDRVCDRLENGWRVGSPPDIADLIAECPDDARRQALAMLLALDQEYRAKAGRPLSPDEGRARYAALGPWAETVLAWAFPAPTVLTVTATAGPHAGERFELTGADTYTIGRQPGVSVSLPKDGKVSRVHLLLTVSGRTVRGFDLGSKGGTFVGGQPAVQWEFANGSGTVRLGKDTELKLTLSGGFDETVTFAGGGAVVGPPAGVPVIPDYALGRELGRGAMGVVYQAVYRPSRATVAVKTILPAVSPTRVMVLRFRREGELLAKLNHPNVVGFHEAGAAGGVLFVAMEFVPGQSASDVARASGTIPADRLRWWADQMLAGLHHAHQLKVVHRDVKPGNLMVTADDTVKVADFGLARAYESSGASGNGVTADGTTCGTLAYMPPEQLMNVRRVGPASDQYAAAATLHQLLTGRPIYPTAATASELVGKILQDDPEPLRAGSPPLSEPFGRAIRRALARDPAARYPSCEAMRQDLRTG